MLLTRTLRGYQPSDLDGVLRVLAEALPREEITTERFTRQVLLDPNFRTAGALVAQVEDEIAGFCLAIARHVPLENAPPDADRGYVTLLGVRPKYRRRGLGTALLNGAEAYLRANGRRKVMVSPYAPGYFIPGVDVHAYAAGLRFFERHGYHEVSRPLAMEAPLHHLDVPAWVRQKEDALAAAGVRVEPYRLELTLPLLEFAQAEFPGDWVRVVREAMARVLAGAASRLLVAHDGGRVLGFAHHEGERFGPIGVATGERGRGLGQVLMFRNLEAMRQGGARHAWFMWTDDSTARRLYVAAGFRETRRFAVLRKALE
jgi:mycothiol synthase